MGCISSLIVSPCLSPALVGVLAYIAHTGNIGLGALALLSLGIGMGLPLLVVGASAIRFLPKTGAWMQTVEHLVGIMMLAVAIWLLSRVIPGPAALFLWSILFIVSAILMGDFTKVIRNWQPIRHSLASLALIYGIILLIGAMAGNSDPFRSWENGHFSLRAAPPAVQPLFMTVNNMAQFNERLAQAKQEKKWVILDFYADWCETCVSMDRYLFSKPAVKQALDRFILLRSDITANNAFDKAIMQRFQVIAPPTLLFFTPEGKELSTERLIGDLSDRELLAHIELFR